MSTKRTRRTQRHDARNTVPRPDLAFWLRSQLDAAVKVEGASEVELWTATHFTARGKPKRYAWVPALVVILTHAGRFVEVRVDSALMRRAPDSNRFLVQQCQPYAEHLLAEAAAGITSLPRVPG